MATIKGQDWASYQSETPSTSGLSFVFIKATEGTGYTNPKMKKQAAHARKAGLVVGFYHFVRPGSMKAQAAYFVKQADSVEGDPLVLDWEDPGVSNADKNAFLSEVKRLRGDTHRVGLYCNTNFWLNKDKGSECGDFLWIAHYGVGAGKPGIKDPWLFHQYTDKPVDTNVGKFGSKAELKAWAEKKTATKPTTPAPSTPKPSPAEPVESQAAKVIAVLRAEVGYREGANNKQKYSPAVPTLEWSQNQPWCQTFQAWGAVKAGTASIEPRTASCVTAANWFKNKGRFSQYPAIGAHVFFGPNGGTHVGRVYAYDADYAYTVEGNTNASGSPNGDGVYLKRRPRRDSYLHGYGMPAFKEGVTTADPELKGKKGFTYKATASAPAGSTPSKDSEELDMDAKRVNAAVWDQDNMPAPPSASTYKTNKTWKASSYFKETYERIHEVKADLTSIQAKLDAQAKTIDKLADALGTAGQFDPEALKREIREAIESVSVRLDTGE